MENGINFRSPESQAEYFDAYEKTMQLFSTEIQEVYVDTEFGKSYVIKAGNKNNPPLVLLHAASCGSPIWYKNFEELSQSCSLYAIDLIGENEFAFDVRKAERRARKCIQHLDIEVVKDASHLIRVSKPEYINDRIFRFLEVNN